MLDESFFEKAMGELRRWNSELEDLETRSVRIPPRSRNTIDIKTLELREKTRSTARLLDFGREWGGKMASPPEEKIGEAIADVREGVMTLSEMIRKRGAEIR